MMMYVDKLCCFFFFMHKTAYEMRISDWSSDVCSSDLLKTMCTRLLAMNTPTADTSNGSHRYVMEIMVRPPRMTHRVWHARFRCPRGRSDAAASAAGQRYSLLPSPL